MKPQITDIFFDLDHTLWDFDKNSALTFQKIFSLHNINIELSEFLLVYEPINLKYWKLYREEKVTKKQLRYGRLKDAFDRIHFNITDATIHQLSIDYIEYLTTFNHLFEGTLEVLNYLKPKYKLHIITNGFEEAQERKLKNSNIKSYFSTITNSEMVGVKKPNPKIFKFALQSASVHSKQSVMVGDSLEADIEGAAHIGMDVIHFDPKNQHRQNLYKRINTLSELKNIL